MKIINKEEFLTLPAGIVYAKFELCVFEDVCIKGDTIGSNDWLYQTLIELGVRDSGELMKFLFDATDNGTSFNLDFNCMTRDGLNEDELFAVFEKNDLNSMIIRLQKSLSEYPESI